MYYLSQRYYDPATMQFISKDPAKADGEMSAYMYCNDDPVNNTDPTGLWGWSNIWGAVKKVRSVVRHIVRAVKRVYHSAKKYVSSRTKKKPSAKPKKKRKALVMYNKTDQMFADLAKVRADTLGGQGYVVTMTGFGSHDDVQRVLSGNPGQSEIDILTHGWVDVQDRNGAGALGSGDGGRIEIERLNVPKEAEGLHTGLYACHSASGSPSAASCR